MARSDLEKILYIIRSVIPLGFKHHSHPESRHLMPSIEGELPIVEREYKKALHQIGTLGGGNHFIEIQKGDDGFIWIMLHSGSRNIGKQVAEHYNRLAAEVNQKSNEALPKSWQLNYLRLFTREGRLYFDEMTYCVAFAFANRKLLMERVQDVIHGVMRGRVSFGSLINIAHNYARLNTVLELFS